MIKEAETHAAEDKKRIEEQEATNYADRVIAMAEQAMTDVRDKASKEQIDAVTSGIEELRKVMAGGTIEVIKATAEVLAQKTYDLGAAAYAAAEAAPAPEAAAVTQSEPEPEPAAEGAGDTSET
jgi:molecular chaperone DnaK